MLLKNIPEDFSAVHFCPKCLAAYSSPKEAQMCSMFPLAKAGLEVGDIVVLSHPYYGWHDGKDHWVAKFNEKERSVDNRGSRQFYWVITAITDATRVEKNFRKHFNTSPHEVHRTIFHLRTLGLKNGDPIGFSGFKSRNEYVNIKKVKQSTTPTQVITVPTQVIIELKQFIGEEYTRLL
jgi:hypothetical protein